MAKSYPKLCLAVFLGSTVVTLTAQHWTPNVWVQIVVSVAAIVASIFTVSKFS